MLHVNDDNNDEIFRKAANDYFLSAGNPDFDKFIGNTDTGIDTSAVETFAQGEKKKPRYFFPVFEWTRRKIIHNWAPSFFRIFWQHLLYGKNKKKINPGFIPLYLSCNYSKYFFETIIYIKHRD